MQAERQLSGSSGIPEVIVLGALGDHVFADLSQVADGADLVVGPGTLQRLVQASLGTVPYESYENLGVTGSFEDAFLSRIAKAKRAVVIASGDPGFFGIVRILRLAADRGELTIGSIHPGPSSVAIAFARLGLSWEDAVVASAHGRDPSFAINVCRRFPKVGVFLSPEFGPAELARALKGWRRRIFVLSDACTPAEACRDCSLEEASAISWPSRSVAVVYSDRGHAGDGVGGPALDSAAGWAQSDPAVIAGTPPAPEWALPEECYTENGSGTPVVTKRLTRASILGLLQPRVGRLLWDVGAGSGSVGVEAAALGAAVVAIERDARRCAAIERNAEKANVDIRVVCGEAPEALSDLPDPDAAYVGGGGLALGRILEAIARRSIPRVVVGLVDPGRVDVAAGKLRDWGYVCRSYLLWVAEEKPVGASSARFEPHSPVFLVEARKGLSRSS